jgi:hypothetical protein
VGGIRLSVCIHRICVCSWVCAYLSCVYVFVRILSCVCMQMFSFAGKWAGAQSYVGTVCRIIQMLYGHGAVNVVQEVFYVCKHEMARGFIKLWMTLKRCFVSRGL